MSCIIDADWLPDDFPWNEFTWLSKDDLKKQCAKRYLPVSGTKPVLRQRLLDYQRTHTTEVRPCPLRLEFPFPSWKTEYGGRSTKPLLPIVLVEDLSTFRVCFKMRFTFASHRVTHLDGNIEAFDQVQVDFTNEPRCSCWGHFLYDLPCLHVEYLLRKVFNTSKLLLWQEAYLTSELEYIYKTSHAALSRRNPDRYRQGKQCVICFAVHRTHELNVPCSLCGLPTHPFCLKALRKKRKCDPAQASQCLVCLDKTALAVAKYFGRSQVSPAVATPVPIPASPASINSTRAPAGSDRSITGAIKSEAVSPDSIERTTTLQEPHSAAHQRCTSTPLPGVPALIWQEMHQQAREKKEQQQQHQEQSEQRQGRYEQKQKEQPTQQQQKVQAKVRAIRPVITEVRVSELPDPARVEVGSRKTAKQTPIAKKPVSKEIGGSLAAAAAAASGSSAHSPIRSSPPHISTATQADECAVNPPGNFRGHSTDAPEESADVANDGANNTTDVPGSALIGTNTIITATLGGTNNNNSNKTDRKAAMLARNLKRLEAKLEQLDRDADYYYTKAERKSQKYQTVQKKIWKIKEKAKMALARRREGVEERTE